MSFVTRTAIDGFFIVEPQNHPDNRGTFQESFSREKIQDAVGVKFSPVQQNLSLSRYGVVRGIHSYVQVPQQKYVSVVSGKILDIVVDLRPDSKTYLNASGVFLDEVFGRKVFISHGLGHCFVSMEENTLVSYLIDREHEPRYEKTLSPEGVTKASLSFHGVGLDEIVMSRKDSIAEGLTPRKFTMESPEIG